MPCAGTGAARCGDLDRLPRQAAGGARAVRATAGASGVVRVRPGGLGWGPRVSVPAAKLAPEAPRKRTPRQHRPPPVYRVDVVPGPCSEEVARRVLRWLAERMG